MSSLAHLPAEGSTALLDLTVGGLLEQSTAQVPDRVALITRSTPTDDGAGSVVERTYAELLERSKAGARALLATYNPGDRIAVWAPNSAAWIELEFAVAFAGLTLVTVNPALTEAEVAYVLEQSRATGIAHGDEYRGTDMRAVVAAVKDKLPGLRHTIDLTGWDDMVAAAPTDVTLPAVDPRAPAQIQYTSGTTGFPKGALLHHRGLVNNARLIGERMGFAEGGRLLNPMPLFHTGGCVVGALLPINFLGTQILVPQFEPGLVLDMAEAHGATGMMAVPTMLIAMMAHPRFAEVDLSALHTVVSGAATVPAELVRQIESTLGVQFGIVYGQTEASPIITQTRPTDPPEDKAGSIGQPLPHTEVKIVRPGTGQTAERGETGEICARGYGVMLGYFDMPEATAEAIDADGWLHTGDLGAMDERGFLTIEGRLKDMIIRGGENIYPREIEDRLFERDDVAEAAIVGIPDAKWGEVVAAFVRPSGTAQGPLDFDVIAEDLRKVLASHKVPKHWVTVESFPMTASGKIQKFVLREQFLVGQEPG